MIYGALSGIGNRLGARRPTVLNPVGDIGPQAQRYEGKNQHCHQGHHATPPVRTNERNLILASADVKDDASNQW